MFHRTLTSQELDLVRHMLAGVPDGESIGGDLSSRLVREMNDGGMGSLRFVSDEPAGKAGREIAKATFNDADGTLATVSLFLDRLGHLYELDIWKVDFSPLQRIPSVDLVSISG